MRRGGAGWGHAASLALAGSKQLAGGSGAAGAGPGCGGWHRLHQPLLANRGRSSAKLCRRPCPNPACPAPPAPPSPLLPSPQIALVPLEEFAAHPLAVEGGLAAEEDPHQLMLNRLKHEVAYRWAGRGWQGRVQPGQPGAAQRALAEAEQVWLRHGACARRAAAAQAGPMPPRSLLFPGAPTPQRSDSASTPFLPLFLLARRQEFVKQLDGIKARRDALAADVAQKRSMGALQGLCLQLCGCARAATKAPAPAAASRRFLSACMPRSRASPFTSLPMPSPLQWRAWKERSASCWRRPARCSSSTPSAQPTQDARRASRRSTRRRRGSSSRRRRQQSRRAATWPCGKPGSCSCSIIFPVPTLHPQHHASNCNCITNTKHRACRFAGGAGCSAGRRSAHQIIFY